jgi:hypothetical protein
MIHTTFGITCRDSRRKYKPQGDVLTRWRYPDHARRKSPG